MPPMELVDDLDLKEPLSAFFGLPIVNVILLLSVGKMLYFQVSSVSWCGIVSLTTLFLSSVIQVVGMRITKKENERWRCGIAYLSTVLRMVAAASLLLFLGEAHTVVVAPLLLLALLLAALFGWETFYNEPTLGGNWGGFKEQLKHHFEFSAQVVTVAFAGLNGTVLGYVKDPSRQMNGGYMAPECFLFYATVLGLIVVLLCTVPTRVLFRDIRTRMVKAYLPILAYASLLFLVLAGVTAAEEILRQYTFFVCFAVVLLATMCFLEDNYKDAEFTNAAGEEDVIFSKYLLAFYFLSCFAGLMATHLKYNTGSGRTVSTSWWLKGFVFSALCGILTYAVRMVVFTGLPGLKISASTKTVWIRGMYVSMAGTFVCLLVVVLLHPDEVQNII